MPDYVLKHLNKTCVKFAKKTVIGIFPFNDMGKPHQRAAGKLAITSIIP